MSRREFRVAVVEPRPNSAWAMVGVASATLWITGQLDAWACAVQLAAFVASWLTRRKPLPWQASPWMLNLGMLGIAVATVGVALRGDPSTVALAHFAALTQGLQLLDARPRRTEFLLVTLALFQVVLAANLTDSVFFTPLLLLFVFAAVWTLIVHTLRSEALEAGRPAELAQAFTPGLFRACLLASALSVLLALLLFVSLPRLRTHVVRGPGGVGTLATSGFSERVEFGELGRIRRDPTVVLRVETLEGEAPLPEESYWRGLAFEHFDGRAWSVSPPERRLVPGSAEGGVELGRRGRVDLVQRIVREPVAAGVLFGVGEPRGLQGTIRRLERDVTGGLYAAGQADERVRYVLRSHRPPRDPAALDRDRALPPPKRDLLSVPPLSHQVAALSARIVSGAGGDAERARAIERYLLDNGLYTDTPPEPSPEAPAADTPLERFLLGGMAGHCEYFASAMVILARQAGLPARLVNGFAGGRTNRIGGFVELSRSDAHAWVEIHFERAGWVRFDPTPADLRSRAEASASLWGRARDLASAAELWWFRRVVGFDRADQIGAMKRAWLAWRGARSALRSERSRAATTEAWAWRGVLERRETVVLGGTLLCLGGLVAWGGTRRRRRALGTHPAYARALRRLARRGLERGPSVGARAFAAQVGAELPEAGPAFRHLTDAYLAERFGDRRAGAEEAAERFERALPPRRSRRLPNLYGAWRAIARPR